MSSDQMQRAQGDLLQSIFGYILSFFSPGFLASLLHLYTTVRSGTIRSWNQLRLTTKAISFSFQDQYIRFYKVGDSFVPIHIFMGDVPHMMPGELQWVYNCSTKVFTEVTASIREERKIPYIAATLTNADGLEVYADMSEWVGDVYTHSTDAFVPPQVLVGAFAFDTQTMLMRDLNSLYLRCMTISLDEVTINVGTGVDIDQPRPETPSESESETQL